MDKASHEQIHYSSDTGIFLNVFECSCRFVASHWHNGLEIIYIADGNMEVGIGDYDYEVDSGGFIVVNSRTIHSTRSMVGNKTMLIQIPYEMLKRNIPDFDVMAIKCFYKGKKCKSKNEIKEIGELLERLCSLYESSHDSGYLLMQTSLVYELLYRLVKDFKVGADPVLRKKIDRNIERLGIVLQYAREHYSEDISLKDAADMTALNREYFARFFKKYMGMTFLDYLYSIRLENAYNDIVNTDYPIVDIVEKNGFQKNYHLFLRKFREQYGDTPGQHRRHLREN